MRGLGKRGELFVDRLEVVPQLRAVAAGGRVELRFDQPDAFVFQVGEPALEGRAGRWFDRATGTEAREAAETVDEVLHGPGG